MVFYMYLNIHFFLGLNCLYAFRFSKPFPRRCSNNKVRSCTTSVRCSFQRAVLKGVGSAACKASALVTPLSLSLFLSLSLSLSFSQPPHPFLSPLSLYLSLHLSAGFFRLSRTGISISLFCTDKEMTEQLHDGHICQAGCQED